MDTDTPADSRFIRRNPGSAVAKILPADADRDGAEVGRDVGARAVLEAKLGVDFQVRGDFAGDAAAEVHAELMQAGMKKVSIDGQACGVAMSPPQEKTVAG